MIRRALCLITDPSSQKYPKPLVSPSLDWLAWLGLASLASAWLVSSAAATTTATTPEQAFKAIAAALRAASAREGLTNGIGYFCDGRGQAKGLTTGCRTGYI